MTKVCKVPNITSLPVMQEQTTSHHNNRIQNLIRYIDSYHDNDIYFQALAVPVLYIKPTAQQMGLKEIILSMRQELLPLQASKRGQSPFSRTNCCPQKLECSQPTQLQAQSENDQVRNRGETKPKPLRISISGYVRATLDLQGTDVLHAALHDVLAAGGELHAPALEVLLIVHGDLHGTKVRP